MKLHKNANIPLYRQLKNSIIEKISSGYLIPGYLLSTEDEMCKEYNISRYPVRQALNELTKEGYIQRKRGIGSFVSSHLPSGYIANSSCKGILGLIMNSYHSDFHRKIFMGFEKQAGKRGYLVTISYTDDSNEEELICLDRMIENGICGVCICPSHKSLLKSRVEALEFKCIYLGLLDRNPDIENTDYVGSDNLGGAYTAVRHIAMRGFRDVVFVSDVMQVSSVLERYEGYMKAVEDFRLNPIAQIDIDQELKSIFPNCHRLLDNKLRKALIELKKQIPFGIFAANDYVAIQCIKILEEEGLVIGRDVAVVGFDNLIEGEYYKTPLTSVVQNGFLIGQSAADMAINKIENKTVEIYRTVIPTQLIIRKSCQDEGTDRVIF